ncbi:uncharacterized protein LOC126908088 isoform X2 [Daktulosphaira vitifoliae]|nr:uncharacterized protein LOC126908088 isoform X2 [Daktulosphaira vitifoliae]XP_050545923.1 uncharacterized protein LOC126908088 isoform X2 [Daktulosphaira vitifoliae]
MTEKNINSEPLEVIWKRDNSKCRLTGSLSDYKIINLENIGLVKRKESKSKVLNRCSKNVKFESMNNHFKAKRKLLFTETKKEILFRQSFQKLKINKNMKTFKSENNLTPDKREKSPRIQSNLNQLNNNSKIISSTFKTVDLWPLLSPKSPLIMSNRSKFTFENVMRTNEIEPINTQKENLKLKTITKIYNKKKLRNIYSTPIIHKSLMYKNAINNAIIKGCSIKFTNDILPTHENNSNKILNNSNICTRKMNENVTEIIEYSPPNFSQKYIPIIEVCNSPKSDKSNQVFSNGFSQKYFSINSLDVTIPSTSLSFESEDKAKLFYKIDLLESPPTYFENNNFSTPKFNYNFKNNKSPSPTQFDSAKKKKKLCKTGYKGKFCELLNHKKSEMCIENFEKQTNMFCRPLSNTILYKVIDVLMEFRKIVLLCTEYKFEKIGIQIIVVLDKLSKKISKYDIIYLYAPWMQVDSINLDFTIIFGVKNVEIVDYNEKRQFTDSAGFDTINKIESFTLKRNALWKCRCLRNDNCSCQEEFIISKYLQTLFLK